MRKFANFISAIFHPLLMPTLGLFLIFSTNSHISFIPVDFRRIIYLAVFVSTCLLPITTIPIFLQLKLINSIKMESRKERLLPLLFTVIYFYLGYLFLKKFQLPLFIPLFFLGTLSSVLFSLIISIFWKISIHMVGIGGVLGALLTLSIKFDINTTTWILITFLVAGIIGFARLYLNAHKPAQIYAGFLLGVLTICSIILI